MGRLDGLGAFARRAGGASGARETASPKGSLPAVPVPAGLARFAEPVPEGGTSCANCRHLGEDGESGESPFHLKRVGSKKLGAPASRFCCMVWRGEA